MCSTCVPTVRREIASSRAISALVAPPAISRATSHSRDVSGAQGSSVGWRARAVRNSSSAVRARGGEGSATVVARTFDARGVASAGRLARSSAAARSSPTVAPSQDRLSADHPTWAAASARRASPVAPVASARRPCAWSIAGRVPGIDRVRSATDTSVTHRRASATSPSASRTRVPVTRNGNR
jgi:hypothetical protein